MKPSYVDQQLFNMGAVSVAKLSLATDAPVETVANDVMASYTRTFDDVGLSRNTALAAGKIIEFFDEAFPSKSHLGTLTQMQFCIKTYHTSGKKRRWRIFGGTMFTKRPEPVADLVNDCMSSIIAYHYLILTDQIPLAPDDWTL